jgi:hypothetical protein
MSKKNTSFSTFASWVTITKLNFKKKKKNYIAS